jgi:hypothetical protein
VISVHFRIDVLHMVVLFRFWFGSQEGWRAVPAEEVVRNQGDTRRA